MIRPFPDTTRLLDTPLFTLWGDGDVLCMKLRGAVAESLAWRGAVDQHTAAQGYPALMVLDIHEATSTGSLASRVKTAGWARATLKKITEAAIYTGTNESAHFVTRALLRVVGMPNVSVVGEAAVVDALIDRYRGSAPRPTADVRVRLDIKDARPPLAALSLDVLARQNTTTLDEKLPADLRERIAAALRQKP